MKLTIVDPVTNDGLVEHTRAVRAPAKSVGQSEQAERVIEVVAGPA